MLLEKLPFLTAEDREEIWIWWNFVWPAWVTFAAVASMDMCDLAFVGHIEGGTLQSSASSAAIILSFTSTMFVRAPCSAVCVLSANAHGASQDELCGRRLQMGLVYSLLLAVFISPTWMFAGELVSTFATESLYPDKADTYGRWRLLGLPPLVCFSVLQSWLAGRKQTTPSMLAAVLSCATNITLNFLLVWGGSYPPNPAAPGFVGSPIATSLSKWSMFLIVLWWSWDEIKLCWPKDHVPSFTKQRTQEFVSLVCPLTLSCLLEELNMQIIAVMAAKFGADELATHNTMATALMFLSTAMLACAFATGNRVSHLSVTGELNRLRRLLRISGTLLVSWGCLVAVIFWILQDKVGMIFSAKPEVWPLAGQVSIVIGCLYPIQGFQYLAISVLEGVARPQVSLVAFLSGCWAVGLPCAWLFGFKVPESGIRWWPHWLDRVGDGYGFGILGLWIGLALGYIVTMIIAGWGMWKELKNGQALVSRARTMADLEGSGALHLDQALHVHAPGFGDGALTTMRPETMMTPRKTPRSTPRATPRAGGMDLDSPAVQMQTPLNPINRG